MDPFIEGQHLWGDFHDNLIIDIQRTVQSQLPPRYVARVCDRTFIETYDPDLDRVLKTRMGPDIEVQRNTARGAPSIAPSAGTALADPPLMEMRGQVEVEEREIFIDIFKLDPDRQLVTSIEVLSPANKRFGSVGWDQYERKRSVFLHGYANLVELDLLRGGRRHAMNDPWPDSPFAMVVIRKAKAPACEVWPGFTTRSLPTIPIPLLPPDADVVVALQPIVSNIYEIGRYFSNINYDKPLQPPLSADEARLLASRTPIG